MKINRILILTLSFLTANMAFAADCPDIALDVSGAYSDGGYSYLVEGTSGIPADNQNSPTQSTLRIFENGSEIGPAHSPHDDIRNFGQGRFSHWSLPDGTAESLRFSSSDDTDPRTNGKSYSYCTNTGIALKTTSSFHAPAPTSSLVVSVKDKGAAGNGSTNDTAAIQAAINQVAGTGGTVLIPAGTYLITHSSAWPYPALTLKSNMTFKMEPGAVIKMKPTSSGAYTLLRIANVTNVNVVGGTLIGERHEHIPTTYDFAYRLDANGQNPGGEWGYGIWVDEGARNVYIEAVTSKEMWGDGFTIGGAGGGANYNVNIYNVLADDNRRQGLSISEADGVVVRDSIFQNTNGAWPKCGIDIEPMGDYQFVDHVVIDNSKFLNNKGCGLILAENQGRHHINNVTVNNCTITGNGWGLSWLNPGVGSSFTNCTITGNSIINIEY